MFLNKFLRLVASSFILTFATISFSHSVSLPCGTAKLIVPWGAGGGTDVIFRQMVDKILVEIYDHVTFPGNWLI